MPHIHPGPGSSEIPSSFTLRMAQPWARTLSCLPPGMTVGLAGFSLIVFFLDLLITLLVSLPLLVSYPVVSLH